MLPQAKQLPESRIFYGIFHARILVSSVQFLSHVGLFETPWTAARQASLSITNSQCLIKLMSIELVMHPNISSSVIPFSSCLQSFPASGSFQWVSSSHQVAKVLEFQLQHQSFQWIFRTDFLFGLIVGSPCSPRDSQESSPTPQFKGISSSVLSFLYSPTLTSILDTGMGGVGFHFLLQGILQGSNPSLLHCRQVLYHWAIREALRWKVKSLQKKDSDLHQGIQVLYPCIKGVGTAPTWEWEKGMASCQGCGWEVRLL